MLVNYVIVSVFLCVCKQLYEEEQCTLLLTLHAFIGSANKQKNAPNLVFIVSYLTLDRMTDE